MVNFVEKVIVKEVEHFCYCVELTHGDMVKKYASQSIYKKEKTHCGLTYLNEIDRKEIPRNFIKLYVYFSFYFVSFCRFHGIFGLN